MRTLLRMFLCTCALLFPAGGPADILGRFLAQGMSAHLGQPVLVENVSGVGGVLGVERAAKSAPDGYTLVP